MCRDHHHLLITIPRLRNFTDLPHKTNNEKCPWKNLKIEETSINDHLSHGDKVGACEETCELCDEFDEVTCLCVFAPCSFKETSKLMASDGAKRFGHSVSVSGTTAIVGAWADQTQKGSAYVFEKDGSTGNWIEVAKLTASDRNRYDRFGRSVSISGNLVIVGAYVDDNEATNSGSAYVFEKDESTGLWFETAKLIASDREAGDQFGLGVSISGEIAVVGAFAEDENGHDSGSA